MKKNVFLGATTTDLGSEFMLGDTIHFNVSGYEKIGEELAGNIVELIDSRVTATQPDPQDTPEPEPPEPQDTDDAEETQAGTTPGDDFIISSVGDDIIDGLGGSDVIVGSTGNDVFDLGDEYDQVNYDGFASDYTLTRNEDQTIIVDKPGGFTDTLSGVDGFWFNAEAAWYSAERLALPDGVFGISQGDDRIIGTPDDDVIDGLGGQDTVLESEGDDVIELGDEYDQVNYLSDRNDYTFTRNQDGSVTVEKPGGGTDTLSGVDGIWFDGSSEWVSVEELAPPLNEIENTSEVFLIADLGLIDI